ncbi:MAG TPA: cyclic nucleotide-binding domain-containing protein [Solirubrobacteraceae bacterium]|nr:cyclic nucleotide-binding domain-containing protein [Solirubrobacteraceae bacterium]
MKRIPLFASVPEDQLSAIAPFVQEVSVSEGHRIVNEGDYSHHFIAIEEGTADVMREDQVVATLGPGDFFGESGVVEKERRNASVVATSPMRLITMTTWELKRMDRRIPEAAAQIRKAIEERRPVDAEQ